MAARELRRRLKNSLVSGIAFGGGLALGSIAMQLLFGLFSRLPPGNLDENTRFTLGILLVFAIAMAGGGIGGFAGGWTFRVVGRDRGRFGYAWHSALSFGIPYGTVLYLLVFLIYSLSIGDQAAVRPGRYVALFSILGGTLGFVYGLILGLLTVGRRFLRVLLGSLAGFALGGAGLGLALWAFLEQLPAGAMTSEGPYWLVLLGLFVLGLVGGTALGFAYDGLAHDTRGRKPLTRTSKVILGIVAAVLVLFVGVRLWGLLLDLDQVLIPRDAHLSEILDTDAVGTHWLYQDDIPSQSDSGAKQPALAAHGSAQLAIAWVEGDVATLHYTMGDWADGERVTSWRMPVELAMDAANNASHPQLAFDQYGRAHMVWLEESTPDGQNVAYALCEADACSPAEPVFSRGSPACGGAVRSELVGSGAIAVDGNGIVLVVWGDRAGNLAYASWRAGEEPLSPAQGCLAAGETGGIYEPRLATSEPSHHLIYNRTGVPDGQISIRQFSQGAWQASVTEIGKGSAPEIWIDSGGDIHAAWCDTASGPMYWSQATTEVAATGTCNGRPAIAQDSEGRIHLVFSSDELANGNGLRSERDVLYEIIQAEKGWTAPMIVALPGSQSQPTLATSSEGTLHLAWTETNDRETLAYATQRQYDCTEYEPEGIAGAVLEISEWPEFRSPGGELAYCQNRYNRLVYAPNPVPEFSADQPTTNGSFDVMAELASTAEYEVLLATMAYEGAVNGEGPGIVIGRAVRDLYEHLRADPSQYPRGLTVRILLGNSPPFATLELNSQLWELLSDLREAGVETMVDPEIGWRLEVANFEGAYPHSHAKLMVVDGKSMIVSGFNMEHRPLPVDHPSGKGGGDTDLGIQVTGPVAQDGRRAFDELWNGAVQRHCTNFDPVYQVWQATCHDRTATVDHVPEVLRHYLAGGDAIAVSMFRSDAHPEADEQTYAALSVAKERIDIMHVSFSYPLLCALNHFFDLCTASQSPEYIQRVFKAVEENGVSARILVGVLPPQGIENVVAINLLRRQVEEMGLGTQVEFRFFDGLVHAKSMLIDDEFLVVGSQNLHYSAFGDRALTEYSIGVTDPQAIEDYQRMFDYLWNRALK